MSWTSLLVVVGGMAGALISAADVLTPQLGNAFARKVVLVQEHANAGVTKPLSTTFTQAETNSYLKYNAGDLLPTGMTQPMITMVGQGRLAGQAVIDLDVVRQK